MGKRSEVTFWQLEVLVEAAKMAGDAAEPRSLSDVASKLGVSRQQVVGAIERLELQVGQSLIEERSTGLYLKNEHLVALAQSVREEFQQFERAARSDGGRWWVRVDATWAHLTHFLAGAINDLETRHAEVRVELVPSFGTARARGGTGLVAQLDKGDADLVVAPSVDRLPPLVEQRHCQRTVLLAALASDHPLLEGRTPQERRMNTLNVAALAEPEPWPLLTSPKGYFSRDLLDLFQDASRSFRVEADGPEPAALAELARAGRRVAIIASDSVISGVASETLPPHWPALVTPTGRLLGRDYSVFHRVYAAREDRPAGVRGVPREVGAWLSELADGVSRRATAHADQRLQRSWRRLKLVDE